MRANKSSFKIIVLIAMLSFIACGKKTNVEGIVYSKHNIPVHGINIDLEIYKGSDYADHTVGRVTTDQNGKYKMSFRFRNNRGYKLFCRNDSGFSRTNYLDKGKNQTIDIYLH